MVKMIANNKAAMRDEQVSKSRKMPGGANAMSNISNPHQDAHVDSPMQGVDRHITEAVLGKKSPNNRNSRKN